MWVSGKIAKKKNVKNIKKRLESTPVNEEALEIEDYIIIPQLRLGTKGSSIKGRFKVKRQEEKC